MAEKKLVDKVKELLDSNANASLKEAAQKWLDAVDDKYGDKIDALKEKGEDTLDKLGDIAEKYSEKSIETSEKMAKVSEKIADGVEKLSDKAAPAVDALKDKAAPVVDKVVESDFVKALKDGVASLDEVIDLFSKPEMKDKMGEEAAEQIRSHAEAMKAEGKKYCDCPACTKAREILRDLGADLEEPEVE